MSASVFFSVASLFIEELISQDLKMEEKLESAVSVFQELYDTSNQNYHNREKKACLCLFVVIHPHLP